MNSTQQLLPGFSVKDDENFETFFSNADSRLLKSSLKTFVEEKASDFVFVSGVTGAGKTHILEAVCNLSAEHEMDARYIPLQELMVFPPNEVLDGAEFADFVCIDDVHLIAGNPAWEEALFHLYNARTELHKPVYFTSAVAINDLSLSLADLHSRLLLCLNFKLPSLSDDELKQLLILRAESRGIELNEASLSYLLVRVGRSTVDLMSVLETIDRATLVHSRKVTVPFLKSIMGW
jgi:DnaA family protein